MMLIKVFYHVNAILKILLYKIFYGDRLKIGGKITFRSQFNIDFDSKNKGSILIGESCFFNRCCTLSSQGAIEIGNNCLFGENVKFYDHNHKFASMTPLKNQGYTIGKIHIGSHCWVGSNVTFLKGADVGDHCVIGAGCVIDGKIPPRTVVKGNRELLFSSIKEKNSRRNEIRFGE